MKIAGIRRSERKQRALAALEQLEMADKATSKALNLSGGQKQRSVIALLAASFGIVNTLFMSVQERTREIGVGIGVIVGTIPAARAARADPVESLRYE